MTERRKIRWLIAHFPANLFIRTAKAFRDELDKLLPGQFTVEIFTLDSFAQHFNHKEFKLVPPNIDGLEVTVEEGNGRKKDQVGTYKELASKWEALFNGLSECQFELSQTQVSIVGQHLHPNFNAIDLPFLWDSHDHVTRVLDGQIGDELCKELADNTEIRGLGFTYSGGYRVIGTSDKITNLSELAQTKLLTSTHPTTALFQEAGSAPILKGAAALSDFGDVSANGGAVETTYLRFTGKNVLKTDHSMFMTTILTSSKFWDTLTKEQQEAFMIAAKKVATIERQWSVDDAEKYEADAESKGITITELSSEDRVKLREAAKASYNLLDKMNINASLVDRIIAQGDNPTE